MDGPLKPNGFIKIGDREYKAEIVSFEPGPAAELTPGPAIPATVEVTVPVLWMWWTSWWDAAVKKTRNRRRPADG